MSTDIINYHQRLSVLNLQFTRICKLSKDNDLWIEAEGKTNLNGCPFLIQYNSDPLIKLVDGKVTSIVYKLIVSPCIYNTTEKKVQYDEILFELLPRDIFIDNCNITYNPQFKNLCKIHKRDEIDKWIWCERCHGPVVSLDSITLMLKSKIDYNSIPPSSIKYLTRTEDEISDINTIDITSIEDIISKFTTISDKIKDAKKVIDNTDNEIQEAVRQIMERKEQKELFIKYYYDDLCVSPIESIQYFTEIIDQRNKDELKQTILKQQEELDAAIARIEAERVQLEHQKRLLDERRFEIESSIKTTTKSANKI